MTFSTAIFVVYEVIIGADYLTSNSPLCPYSDRMYSFWYHVVNYFVLGGFCFTWSILLIRIYQAPEGNERVPFITAFSIVSMGTVATILAVVFNWGGVCVDQLG